MEKILNSSRFEASGFHNILTEKKTGQSQIRLRLNARDRPSFELWKEIFCESAQCSLNSFRLLTESRRNVFGQVLMCQHGLRGRTKGKRRTFTECPFKLAVTIKKVTERKAKRDALLRSHPCFITIDQEHNHSTTCARALRELRVLPTVKASLEEYFEQGLGPTEAWRAHLLNVKAEGRKIDLRRGDINPSKRTIAYIFDVWRKNRPDGQELLPGWKQRRPMELKKVLKEIKLNLSTDSQEPLLADRDIKSENDVADISGDIEPSTSSWTPAVKSDPDDSDTSTDSIPQDDPKTPPTAQEPESAESDGSTAAGDGNNGVSTSDPPASVDPMEVLSSSVAPGPSVNVGSVTNVVRPEMSGDVELATTGSAAAGNILKIVIHGPPGVIANIAPATSGSFVPAVGANIRPAGSYAPAVNSVGVPAGFAPHMNAIPGLSSNSGSAAGNTIIRVLTPPVNANPGIAAGGLLPAAAASQLATSGWAPAVNVNSEQAASGWAPAVNVNSEQATSGWAPAVNVNSEQATSGWAPAVNVNSEQATSGWAPAVNVNSGPLSSGNPETGVTEKDSNPNRESLSKLFSEMDMALQAFGDETTEAAIQQMISKVRKLDSSAALNSALSLFAAPAPKYKRCYDCMGELTTEERDKKRRKENS